MSLSFLVGGTQGTFEERLAREVAGVLDNAFGAEGDWEGSPPRSYGETLASGWADLQARAACELGSHTIPNLLALASDAQGVYLPTSVRAVCLPLQRGLLNCASLTGLRRELETLAEHWDLPSDDSGLERILQTSVDPDDGPVADAPEILTFALLALAANEATRRGCPLWLVGNQE